MASTQGRESNLRESLEAAARVCLNPGFAGLAAELEALYGGPGAPDAKENAFRDAYYSIAHELDSAGSPVRAMPVIAPPDDSGADSVSRDLSATDIARRGGSE